MIIYDSTQQRAVNLSNVDTILPGQHEDGYVIYFERALPGGANTTIARWDFKTRQERDHSFNLIIKQFGSPLDGDNIKLKA